MTDEMTARRYGQQIMMGVKKNFSSFTIDVVTTDGERTGYLFQPEAFRLLHDQIVEMGRRHPGFGEPKN